MNTEIKKDEELNYYEGFIAISKPNEDELIFKDFSYDTSEEGLTKAFTKIIELVTGSVNGKIANTGYLPNPLNEFTAFVDYDQYNPDTKYNFGFFGTPIYGNIVFLMVDTKTEDGKVLPIPEIRKKELKESIARFKKFEKDTGIYKSMTETDKIQFLDEFIKEQNSILNESTKDIKGDNYEELQKAKEELAEATKNSSISEEDLKQEN